MRSRAFSDDDLGNGSGSAYIFVSNGVTWTQEKKLLASDGMSYDSFGFGTTVLADTAVVGAPYADGVAVDSGAAYVYTRSGGIWSFHSKLIAADGVDYDDFGISLSLSGNTLLVGADGVDDSGVDAGAAYVFVENAGTWTQEAKLLASDGATNDYFGWSVSLSGDSALMGAYGDDDNGAESGSAYVFVRNAGVWSQQQKLIAAGLGAGDIFGVTVSLSGDSAMIGSIYDDDLGVNSGAAYVFDRSGGVWANSAKLVASDGGATDWFSYSISLSGDTALVGARYGDDKGSDSGAA